MDFGKLALTKANKLEEAQAAGGSGHISTEKVEVFPLTEISVRAENLNYPSVGFANPISISGGDKVSVIWDGITYKGTAVDDGVRVYFGDYGLLTGEKTGAYPFLVWYVPTSGSLVFVSETFGKHTVAVDKFPETIHPINPKFLPEPNVVDENIWGAQMAMALAKMTAANGTAIEHTAYPLTGLDGVNRFLDEVRPLCQDAEKIRFTMNPENPQERLVECPITLKTYEGEELVAFSFGASVLYQSLFIEGSFFVTFAHNDITICAKGSVSEPRLT